MLLLQQNDNKLCLKELKEVLIISIFGEYIKNVRIRKELSLKELSKRSGISHPYISQIENGKRNIPKPEMIKKLAKGLGINYFDLLSEAGYLPDNLSDSDNFKKYISDLKSGKVKAFGSYIQELRQSCGKTIEELSEDSGFSIKYLMNIEHGFEMEPPKSDLIKLGKALGIDNLYDWFINNTQYPLYAHNDKNIQKKWETRNIFEVIDDKVFYTDDEINLYQLVDSDINLHVNGYTLIDQDKMLIQTLLELLSSDQTLKRDTLNDLICLFSTLDQSNIKCLIQLIEYFMSSSNDEIRKLFKLFDVYLDKD
jgi:transcriptional regulator with XRE-family HTH domain